MGECYPLFVMRFTHNLVGATALGIVARGAFLLIAFSLIVAMVDRISGIDSFRWKPRRRAAQLQRALWAILVAGFLVESWFYWTSVRAGQPTKGIGLALLWLSSWSIVPWTVMIVSLLLATVFFLRVHYSKYINIKTSLACLADDPDRIVDDASFRTIRIAAVELEKVFPPGLGFLCRRLQVRIDDAITNPSPEILVKRAAAFLERDHIAQALKCVLKVDGMTTEAMLIAVESQDWRESSDLMRQNSDSPLRMESAQLMAEPGNIEEYQDLAMGFMGSEHGRRRRASIEFRRGNKQRALELLGDDWEARSWFRKEEPSAGKEDGGDSGNKLGHP